MLDAFEILTTSGVVLWSKSYVPVSANIINSLIADVLIEERITPNAGGDDLSASRNPPYKKDQYILKWTTAKDLGLIFVVSHEVFYTSTMYVIKPLTSSTCS
jgi:signal recognition particle receptor subunit alpha